MNYRFIQNSLAESQKICIFIYLVVEILTDNFKHYPLIDKDSAKSQGFAGLLPNLGVIVIYIPEAVYQSLLAVVLVRQDRMMQSTLTQSRMTVFQPHGHLNAANAAALEKQLAETVSSREHASLVVDMSRVESLDSDGLMVLVSTLTLAQRLNKRFSLCGLSPSTRIMLEVTQLDRVFEILEQDPGLVVVAA